MSLSPGLGKMVALTFDMLILTLPSPPVFSGAFRVVERKQRARAAAVLGSDRRVP